MTAIPAPADALAAAEVASTTGHVPGVVHNHRLSDSYRPEVDGLRAVAVLAVLFYHAGLSFPGGYVGVDVFFVISGFLITSLIVKDLDAGKFSLSTFYERRARRIVPALLAMLLAVLIAGWWLLLADDLVQLGKSVIAQALFSANIYFYRAVDYFAGSAEQLPLLHTWSLAVEEQFYFFFPLLLMVCYKFKRLRTRGSLVSLFTVIFIFSLAISIMGVKKAPDATFYLLPTRTWELLAGSLLAVFPLNWNPSRKIIREALAWLGLVGIGFACFAYTEETAFPGLAAIPPVIGAALIIWANAKTGRPEGEPGLTSVGRLLATPPVVFIGLISYSLYLWHWPLLAFSKYWAFEELSLGYRWQMVGLSIVLAVLSWWLVETPFRRRKLFVTKPAVLAFGGGFVAASVMIGIVLVYLHGIPNRFDKEVADIVAARTEFTRVRNVSRQDLANDRLIRFGEKDQQPGKVGLLVWGDSHAERLLPALDAYGKEHGLAGRAVINSATSPLLGFHIKTRFGLNAEAIPFGEALLKYVKDQKIPAVMLVAMWERDLTNAFTEDADKDVVGVVPALKKTVERFNAEGVKVYVMLQVPYHRFDVPKAMAYNEVFDTDAGDWEQTIERHNKTNARMYECAKEISSPMCVFIDPAPAFIGPDGLHYVGERDGAPLFSDNHHLTRTGAMVIMEPLLEKALGRKTPG